jgi:hypothetical protein
MHAFCRRSKDLWSFVMTKRRRRFEPRLNTVGNVMSVLLPHTAVGVVSLPRDMKTNRAALYPLPTTSLRSVVEEGGLRASIKLKHGIAYSTGSWLLLSSALWLTLYAVGYAVPPEVVLFLVPLSAIMNVLPLSGALEASNQYSSCCSLRLQACRHRKQRLRRVCTGRRRTGSPFCSGSELSRCYSRFGYGRIPKEQGKIPGWKRRLSLILRIVIAALRSPGRTLIAVQQPW